MDNTKRRDSRRRLGTLEGLYGTLRKKSSLAEQRPVGVSRIVTNRNSSSLPLTLNLHNSSVGHFAIWIQQVDSYDGF